MLGRELLENKLVISYECRNNYILNISEVAIMNVKFVTLLRTIMKEKNLEPKAVTSHVVANWVK